MRWLDLKQWYRGDGPSSHDQTFSVRITGYHYGLLDAVQRDLLVYHWHPERRSHIAVPHLHLPAANPMIPGASSVHFPSGRVSLNEVIRLAIDLGARPGRRDWERALARTAAEIEGLLDAAASARLREPLFSESCHCACETGRRR